MRFRRILTATVVVSPVSGCEHGETAQDSRGVPELGVGVPARTLRCETEPVPGRVQPTILPDPRGAPDHSDPAGPTVQATREVGRLLTRLRRSRLGALRWSPDPRSGCSVTSSRQQVATPGHLVLCGGHRTPDPGAP